MKAAKFPNSFQSKTIAAGSSDTVYIFRVPKSAAGFIEEVACVIPNDDCYYKWDIDGEPVEEGRITYSIANINEPKKYEPKIVVKNWVRWIGVNGGATDETFEVLCDGVYCRGDEL